MSSNTLRTLILIFVIVYGISPLDACPGIAIDDIIVIILGIISRNNLLEE